MPTVLVRRPGPRLADGIVTHQARVPIDVELALCQWERYVETVREHGWDVVEVEPADDCPDAVFVEDAVVVFGDLAVVARPGAPDRRPETAGAEAAARAVGLGVARLGGPGTLDGGDVLKIGTTAFVGVGGRTDERGVAELAELIAPRGWDVRSVAVGGVLHLKSAVTALPDGTVVGFGPHVDDRAAFDRFLSVPEPAGAHVVLLGEERLLMSADAPVTAGRFRSMGYEPVLVDISEFEKLEGCVTCLSVRIRR